MKLRIGHIDYKLKKKKSVIDEDGTECIGLIDYHESTISLRKDVSEQVSTQTLIHEVMHGIMVESGFESGEGIHTEENVNRLGLTLHGFLKDNIDTLNKIYNEKPLKTRG